MIDYTALDQSGVLTLVGMAVIFLFMGLLIVITHYFVAVATRFFPDRDGDGTSSGTGVTTDEETAAAIATALFQHDRK